MLLSTLTGEDRIDTSPMTVEIENTPRLSRFHSLNSNLGVSLAGTVHEDVGVAEVPTHVFPNPSPTSILNDNYCVGPKTLHVKSVRRDTLFCKNQLLNSQTLKLDVPYHVVFHAPSVHLRGLPPKKEIRPVPYQNKKIKHVKAVCCVNPCLSVPPVSNVPKAVSKQNVGGRLQRFWQVWQNMGANPRVVSILKECYTLPFKQRPCLIRFPLVQSGYASPIKNLHLKEALLNLMGKLVVEKVVVRLSLAFYNRLFSGPKTQQKMEANFRSESGKCISKHGHVQDGNSGDNPVILENRRVDYIAGLQRRILPHSNCPKVKEIS